MAAGAAPVARVQPAEADAEVGVVVDGLDVERGEELLLGGGEPAALEVGAREGLADGTLLGFE